MKETVLQFVVGGLALVALVWLKLKDVVHVLCPPGWGKLSAWLARVIHAIAAFVAAGCLLDPMIGGTASLTIHAPRSELGLETLVVEAMPVGFFGEAGGNRVRVSGFDARGVSQITVSFESLETHVKLRVFDESSPSRSVVKESFYVSPFVRRRLATRVVYL